MTYLAIALISGGMLLLELALTRVFAVAQFHHFAFMLISLALLGIGASGTLLALAGPGKLSRPNRWPWFGLGYAATALGSYLVLNFLPFDSFSIAWDARQVLRLAVDFLGLAVPFLFGGLAIGAPLVEWPAQARRLYAANLIGSAGGCVLVVLLPSWVGGEGLILAAAGMGALGGALFAIAGIWARPDVEPAGGEKRALALNGAAMLALAWILLAQPDWLALRWSAYKPLAQALNFPGARVALTRWSATARLDVIESPGIRSLPGLSFAYAAPPPPQAGLMVDADSLAPIAGAAPEAAAFADYLPARIAFSLRPKADVLVIEPGGGLDVLAALASGARRVTAVHTDPAALEILARDYAGFSRSLYLDRRVTATADAPRAYLRRTGARFDVVQLALTDPYRPVTSGAYSLGENYLLTAEAVREYLAHLAPDGVFVLTRWLQSPPSEELRTYALIRQALNSSSGVDSRVIAFRSFQAATFLVRPAGFSAADMDAVREFAATRKFDLVVGPGLRAEETNRFNVLPDPAYYSIFAALGDSRDPQTFYRAYPFDVRPPTDDRPFFFHFFKWAQTPRVLQMLGRTWQPFGGSGYFVLVALLGLAAVGGGILISLPLAVRRRRAGAVRPPLRPLTYFACLGLAFLLVEIPLTQEYILLLGRPIYALAAVLGGMLAFSGIGSWLSGRIPLRRSLLILAGLALIYPLLLPAFFGLALAWPFGVRVAAAVISLAPLGFLMGMPFPAGLARFSAPAEGNALVPWAWAANGSASVLSGVLAAMLALSFGLRAVIWLGGLVYLGAFAAASGKG